MIETNRLKLRPLTTADVDRWLHLYADERMTRFVGRYSHERALARLEDNQREWEERGYGLFALELKDTGEFVGRCGLHYWKQFREVEIGWAVTVGSWGLGYATESARAILTWGFSRLPDEYFTSMMNRENLASRRVAQRLGFTQRRTEKIHGDPMHVFAVDRPPDAVHGPSAP